MKASLLVQYLRIGWQTY